MGLSKHENTHTTENISLLIFKSLVKYIRGNFFCIKNIITNIIKIIINIFFSLFKFFIITHQYQ